MDKRPRVRDNGANGGRTMPEIDAALGFRVTKELKARLEQQAKRERRTVTALIVQAVEDYLAAQEGGGRKKKGTET